MSATDCAAASPDASAVLPGAAGAPKVSVVIPTFNRAAKLARAMHSVLCQSYRNLELIVVDDCSGDDTEAVVRACADARVRYIRMAANVGANAARNAGIRAATADFVAFQDSDDEWLGDKLARQMAVFLSAGQDVGVVYSGFIRCDGRRLSYVPNDASGRLSGDILDELLAGNFVGTPTAIVRRECLLAVGLFDERLPRLQDWELFIRLAKQFRFACVDAPLVLEHHDADCITSNPAAHLNAIEAILQKHADLFATRPVALAQHYYVAGKTACKVGMMRDGIASFFASLRANPRRIMAYVRIAAALPGPGFYRWVFRHND